MFIFFYCIFTIKFMKRVKSQEIVLLKAFMRKILIFLVLLKSSSVTANVKCYSVLWIMRIQVSLVENAEKFNGTDNIYGVCRL